METRLLRVKHDEPSQVVILEHQEQAGKYVASEWVKNIMKGCTNITHIVVASKIRSAHFRLYKDNELYYLILDIFFFLLFQLFFSLLVH